MFDIQEIPLDQIDPNPYQPREKEDPDHVARIAASIREKGLLQFPIGRQAGERVQLAFGHTRLASFRLNQEPTMPVYIREITDQELFEMAIRENMERQDLTPIEEARAMCTYRDQFDKTSAQIGKLFGCSESAVRNKMRLLNLAEPVQEKVSTGEITEGAARTLLTVQRIAPDAVSGLATQIANGGGSAEVVERAVSQTLQNRDGITWMHHYYDSGTPTGGKSLWPLSWAPETGLPAKKIAETMGERWSLIENLQEAVSAIIKDLDRPVSEVAHEHQVLEAMVEEIAALARPGACTRCPFYAVSSGNHYCGMKACYQRKKHTWMELQLQETSKILDVPILDPKKDGKEVESISWETKSRDKFKKWLNQKADHLRLRIRYETYNPHKITDSHIVELVSVNDEYRKAMAEQKQLESGRKSEQSQSEVQQKLAQSRREQSHVFLREVATPAFKAIGLGRLSVPALEGLARTIDNWDVDRLLNSIQPTGNPTDDLIQRGELCQRFIVFRMLNRLFEFSEKGNGSVYIADQLRKVAADWLVTLPGDWDTAAQELESVSTETNK